MCIPKLEYSSPIWNPQQKTQIKKIEQVQRNAARFVLKKPFNYQNPTSVTSLLSELKWPTLEQRKSSFDIIFMYKIVQQLVAVPINYLQDLVPSPRYNMNEAVYICNTNSSARNNMKFVTYHCNINAYQHSFFLRVIIPWNNLPETTLRQSTLDGFKAVVHPSAKMC